MSLTAHYALILFCAACAKNTGPASKSSGVLRAIDNRSAQDSAASTDIPRGAASTESDGVGEGTETDHKGPPRTPPISVAAPPDDAEVSELGVFHKVLIPGSEGRVPGHNDVALVHYTGWRTSGELIYTTASTGTPQPMPVPLAAPGWRDVLLDMHVGERRMVWMSSRLASSYGGGSVQEILVFAIDLVDIEPAPATPSHLRTPPEDARTTSSGLAYQILERGTGTDHPTPWDKVSLRYTLWNQDGQLITTTLARSSPDVMQLYLQSKGWSEAVQLLVQGGKLRVWLPEDKRTPLRPGDQGGMQVADIELVTLEKQIGPPPTPEDVAKPPATAKKTAKGVYYVILEPGTGKVRPSPESQVKVHYTGWTTDGEMFDSSLLRGKPTIFPLGAVIEGWTDVLQVMVAGQKIRTWIPQELAYQGKPDRPRGMLVFEIELLDVDPQ